MQILQNTNLLFILAMTPTNLFTLWVVHNHRAMWKKENLLLKNNFANKFLRKIYYSYVALFYPLIIYMSDIIFSLLTMLFGFFFWIFVCKYNTAGKRAINFNDADIS